MSKIVKLKNFIFNFVISSSLSFFFIYKIPWHNIKYFQDFERYKITVSRYFIYGFEQESSGIFLLFSEALWNRILLSLPLFFYDIDSGITFISFFCLTVYIFFTISRKVNPFIAFIFLLNPIFIDLIISQVRIALAFSLLIIAYSLRKIIVFPIILICCATLIHTATLLFFAIYALLMLSKKIFSNNLDVLRFSFVLPIFIMIALQLILLPVFDYFGDEERTGYITNPLYSSLFFSFPWVFFSSLFMVSPKNNIFEKNIDIVLFAICMGSLFFVASIFKFYGSRFVAVSFPFFIVSINSLSISFKRFTFLLLFFYQLIYFSYWL